ncbi:MAG: MFS transporter [Pseudorhizobium sp.]
MDTKATEPQDATEGDASWTSLLAGPSGTVLALISSGIALHAFNQFAIVAAMPLAAAELNGTASFSWAYSLYFIGSIAGGTAAAAYRDRLGARNGLILASLLFSLGGLLAIFAPSFVWLLGGRALQGVADGLIVALCYSLIPANFPPRAIARVFAIEAVVWAGASLVGPLAGGLLAEAASWRMAFLAVAPLVVALPVLAILAKPKVTASAVVPMSLATIVLSLVGALMLSLSSLSDHGAAQVAAVAVAALVFFLAIRLDGRLGPRLFPLNAFRLGSVVGHGFWVLLLMSASHSVGSVYLALMIRSVFGFRPAVIGYIVVLMALSWSVVAIVASRAGALPARHRLMRSGPLFQLAGFAMLAAGFGLQWSWLLVAGQLAIGTGFGFAWASVNEATMAAAPRADRDRTGSLLPTVSTAGYAIGASLAGLITTASGLVPRLASGQVGEVAVWLYGTAGALAVLAFLLSLGVRLEKA